MAPDSEIDDVFRIVSQQLAAANIHCLMIGGHAVNHYGYSRATQDVDFMIATSDHEPTRRIMTAAGFTNQSMTETVDFFNRPGSPLRVDFLKVDRATLDELLSAAVSVLYLDRHEVKVPCLRDLIAMKVFALASGSPGRRDRDSADIVHLAVENRIDLERDLLPLCERFGTAGLYEQLSARIKEMAP